MAKIVMRRLITFHVIQTYIPTAMLVVISWLSFWLDAKSAPARIGLTITTLLTLFTMSNGARQDLPQVLQSSELSAGAPQVSYIKAMDIWVTVCCMFVFCVLIEYTLVSFFLNKRVIKCCHLDLARKMTTVLNKVTTQVGGRSSQSCA